MFDGLTWLTSRSMVARHGDQEGSRSLAGRAGKRERGRAAGASGGDADSYWV